MTTPTLPEAARMALEALRYYANESFDGYAQPNGATAQDCITKVSAALAASEAQAEPVGVDGDVAKELARALYRIERAVDWHLGRSAFTQTKHLKGLQHSENVRKELYAAGDEARAALSKVMRGGMLHFPPAPQQPAPADPHRDHWVAIARACEVIATSPNCGPAEARALCDALDRLTAAELSEQPAQGVAEMRS